MPTPDDVAAWMLMEVMRSGYAEQESIAFDIQQKFGEDFLYENENGNQAIDKIVLQRFKKISSDSVVWVRSEKAWRKREAHDEKGRTQD